MKGATHRKRKDRLPDRGHHHFGVDVGDAELEDVPVHARHCAGQRERSRDEHQQHHEQRGHDGHARLFDSGSESLLQYDSTAQDDRSRGHHLQDE
jgi:hypothetical protein